MIDAQIEKGQAIDPQIENGITHADLSSDEFKAEIQDSTEVSFYFYKDELEYFLDNQ